MGEIGLFGLAQVSLDNVAQTLARTTNQEDTDEIFEEGPTPNFQDDGEVAPEDEQAKSVENENHLVGKEEEPETIVEKAPPMDQP
nr:hypothetical protein CFP56_60994 [Quercus suber]